MLIPSTKDIDNGRYYVPVFISTSYKRLFFLDKFLIDTGATTTSLSWNNAQYHRIDIRKLTKASRISSGIGGRVDNYVLPDSTIIFITSEGRRCDYKISTLYVKDYNTVEGFPCPEGSNLLGIDTIDQFDFVIQDKKAFLIKKLTNRLSIDLL